MTGRHYSWALVLLLEPGDHPGQPDHVVDQWHVVRRNDGIHMLGWESPGEWEPVMSGLLSSFDVLIDTVADVDGVTYRLEAAATGGMHPRLADYLERMSAPGPKPR